MGNVDTNPKDIHIYKPAIKLTLPKKDKFRLMIELNPIITCVKAPKL
jgi:hypothetical protein